jgi:hypothetical protein
VFAEGRRYRVLAWLLMLIGIFNCLDFLATQHLVVYGQHSEWNPVMRPLVGTVFFLLYKLVAIPVGLSFLWLVRRWLVAKFMGLVSLTCLAYALVLVRTWVVFYSL